MDRVLRIAGKPTGRSTAYLLALAVAVTVLQAPIPSASAATVNWTDGTGNWSVAANWTTPPSTHNVPAAGDDVNITAADGVNRTITYNYTGAAISLGGLVIDLTNYSGAATTTLAMAANTLTVSADEFVGYNGTGTFNQSGGTNTVSASNVLVIGYNSDSRGTYTLSGTGALVATGSEYVGYDGSGTFNQSGGTNTLSAGHPLYLAYGTNSTGNYTLSGTGLLSVTSNEYIGTGNFNQSGGTNTINSGYSLELGANSLSSSTYTLSGTGALSVTGNEYVGYVATGIFNQSGGTNIIGSGDGLYLGFNNGSSGTYTLSGTGSLAVTGFEEIGSLGTGTFNQSGGTHTISSNNALYLAFSSGSSGAYTLSGTGALVATGNEYLGYTGTGTFSQTGGTHTVNSGYAIYLGVNGGSSGTYTLSGGSTTISGSGSFFVGGQALGGTGILNVSGTGTLSISGNLIVYSNAGCAINLSGGTINTAALDFNGVPSLLNWTGGTLNLTSNVTWDSGASSTSTSDAFGPSLSLGNNQTLMVTGNETLGGTGAFGLTLNSGSSHYVTGSITLSPAGTITQNAGSSLYAATITQAGGTVNGTLQNQGNFVYHSGQFNGRLLNQGTLDLGPSFAAGNGVENDASMTLAAGQTLTVNGAGLNNLGTFTLSGGVIAGAGPVLNNFGGNFQARGTINSVFTNDGILTVSGVLAFTNAAPAVNIGILQGSGTITGNFSNAAGGTITVATGNLLAIASAWTNAGLVNLQASGAVLAGASITNSATIQGAGTITAPIINSSGIIRAQGGELDLAGAFLSNPTGGQFQVATGGTLLCDSGLSTNAGIIALQGGTFDNNNRPLANSGSIEGSGSLRTGGLTISSTGFLVLSDADSAVYGAVTNDPGANIKIISNTTTFYGPVTNNGTIKVTGGVARFLGNGPSLTVGGTYISDPSDNYITGLSVTPSGLVTGGSGDRFFLTAGASSINAGTFTNGGLLDSSENITNTGTFTQSGPQSWATATTFSNTGGIASFQSDAGSSTSSNLSLIVNGGTVLLTGAQHLNAVALNGGTLGGHATILASVTLGSAPHTIAPSATLAPTATGALTFPALTTNTHTTLAFNLVSPGISSVNDQLIITTPASLTLNGGNIQIANTSTGKDSLGYYKAIQYFGTIQGAGLSSIVLPAVSNNIAYILDTSHDPGYIDLHRGFLGDANDDGIVNAIDLGILATNYNSTTANWSTGDYNGDGIVNAIDLGILATNYNAVVGAESFDEALSAYPVLEADTSAPLETPEPASLTILGLAAATLLARRRRRTPE